MKKFIVILCVLLPLSVFSQELKIAYVNVNEVFNMMPELEEAETQFAAFMAQYESEINAMRDEYRLKVEEYMKVQETLAENLKQRREQEIIDLENRIQTTYMVYQEDRDQKQAELMAPIQEKIQIAIQAVGDEQGYTSVQDVRALLYVGRSAIDATELVKAKLGLR